MPRLLCFSLLPVECMVFIKGNFLAAANHKHIMCLTTSFHDDFADSHDHTPFINPRRMREGYGSRSVCECVCVCLLSRQLLHTWLIRCKQGVIRLFTAFLMSELCGFR